MTSGQTAVTTRQPAERLASWQAMDSGRLLLLAAAGMLTVAAIAHSATTAVAAPHPAVAFGVLIALGELLRLALPGGREAAPIATAGAMAYALLLYVGQLPGHGKPIQVSPLQVIAVAAIAMTIGALPHMAAGRPDRDGVPAGRGVLRGLRVPPADQHRHDRQRLVAGRHRDDGAGRLRLPRRCGDRGPDQG